MVTNKKYGDGCKKKLCTGHSIYSIPSKIHSGIVNISNLRPCHLRSEANLAGIQYTQFKLIRAVRDSTLISTNASQWCSRTHFLEKRAGIDKFICRRRQCKVHCSAAHAEWARDAKAYIQRVFSPLFATRILYAAGSLFREIFRLTSSRRCW